VCALDLYRDERLFERAHKLEPRWAEAAMSLKGLPNVLDVRCVGLTAGIDLASRPGEVGKRAYDAMDKAFREQDLVIRAAGETVVLTPPLIVSEGEIEEMFAKAARVIKAVA
jgi:beta-alanine--pyruvate transaminase